MHNCPHRAQVVGKGTVCTPNCENGCPTDVPPGTSACRWPNQDSMSSQSDGLAYPPVAARVPDPSRMALKGASKPKNIVVLRW